MTIIGLGDAGCNIAEKFEKVDSVKVILIDAEIEGDGCISLKKCNTPEEYEASVPDFSKQLSTCDEKIVFFVGGSGKISGAALRILSQLKHKELNVVYIKPDTSVLNYNSKLQDRLVFNVFQEYARSGLFKRCILLDNAIIEKLLGDIPLIGFYDKLNDVIFNALGFILTHEEKSGIVNNLVPCIETERICTVGFFDLTTEEESLLYELENSSNKHFYFVFNEERLRTDGSLSKKIKQIMQNKDLDNSKSSYIIYSTKQQEEYCYIIAYSKQIQK
jgi:hypothetical protein